MKRSPVSLFMILLVICLCLFTGCDDVAQTNTPEYLFTSSDLEKYTIIYPIDNSDYYDFAIQLADVLIAPCAPSAKNGRIRESSPDRTWNGLHLFLRS